MLRAALLTAIAFGTLLAPQLAHACAACACGDPTLTVMGTGKSFAGRSRLSAEWRRRAESSPRAFGDARVVEDRLTLGVSHALLDQLQVALSVPLVARAVDYPTMARDETAHLGDVDLMARWILRGARGWSTHQLGVAAGVRLPSAPEVRGASGQPLPLDAQPGNGAWMPSVGGWYGLFANPWSAHLSAAVIAPGEGHERLAPGVAGLLTAHGQYQWPIDLALRAGLDGRWTADDRVAGARVARTGGPALFTTAGLLYSPLTDLVVHVVYRVPVLDARGSGERAEPSLAIGLTHDL